MDTSIDKLVSGKSPLDQVEETDYEWLGFGDKLPPIIANPFPEPSIGSIGRDVTEEILDIMLRPDYLHFTAKMILGVELLPYQLVILDTLWQKSLPMVVGSRGAAKSFILGVYCLLRMILNPGCRIVIVGAGLRQARQVFDYMATIWDKASVLRDIAGRHKTAGPRREVDRFQFEIGDSNCIAIPLGSGDKIRGLRANYIIADEIASVPEEIFNVVVQGFGVVSRDPIEKVKELATINRLKEKGEWTEQMESLNKEQRGANQIIYSGTAFYSFNHFYKRFKQWHSIIASKGDPKKLKELFGDDTVSAKGFRWDDYAIIRLPYTHLPEGMLDEGILAQGKATLSRSQFLMEFGAIFATDSDGFYKRSVLEQATTNKPILINGKYIQFNAVKTGERDKVYVMGVDPAADQDNAAIVIIEINEGYRSIVHCWTTNKKKYVDYRKYLAESGQKTDEEYYRYIARKIRQLMRQFNIEHIIMDKNGGGTAIAEALASKETCESFEYPVYTVVDPEDPKQEDMKEGVHILQLLAPTQDINVEANHGMLKDFQDKTLLFPLFNITELAKSIEIDAMNNVQFDTYEDLVQEVEDLKTEITTVVVTPSASLGKETFDTPRIKGTSNQKGRLRKDRYSALLYANYYARNKDKNTVPRLEYRVVGGTKDTLSRTVKTNTGMYYGPGVLKFGVKNPWIRGGKQAFIKHRS